MTWTLFKHGVSLDSDTSTERRCLIIPALTKVMQAISQLPLRLLKSAMVDVKTVNGGF
jgi:hypothetical protein